jgi:hypothetical protein
MTTTEPSTLRYHAEVDPDDYYRPMRDWEHACEWAADHNEPQPPFPEDGSDIVFDATYCVMCNGYIGPGLHSREDSHGREIEYEAWITMFRGPLGLVCEDCVQPAEEAVARLLRSDWFLPAATALRFYLHDHPDSVLRDWFTAANLSE